MAWLEGEDRQSYAVAWAGWTGKSWSRPVLLAEKVAGSQLAMVGARLADGSQLLLWTRFDGHDDEIVGTRLAEGVWSEVKPIAPANEVPDITPSVVAIPGGALASWSRYDGREYRVVVSKFDGEHWSEPVWAAAPGSSAPTLVAAGRTAAADSGAGAALLSYTDARGRGWGVVELDSAGRALRRGTVADTPRGRPAVDSLPSGAIRLRWAGAERLLELE
jgi:hypothetical protein